MEAISKFTKTHTSISKGFAILLMVYHHLFVVPDRLGGANSYKILFISNSCQQQIAIFAKICVGLFLFLSGLGLYSSLSSETTLVSSFRKAFNKLFRFMTNYWIIAVIVFPLGLYIGFFDFDLLTVLGVVTGYYPKVMEWWFVCQYVVLLIISPLFIRLIGKTVFKEKILCASLIFLIYALIFAGNHYMAKNPLIGLAITYLSYLCNWPCVSVFIVGILCARFNIYRYFVFKEDKLTTIVNSLIFIVAVALRASFVHTPESMQYDFIIAPLLAFSFSTLVYRTRRLQSILCFFSRHSTNIWLTHTFWCYYFGQAIVLLPHYSILIYIWLLILSVASSYLINLIYIPLSNKLFPRNNILQTGRQ